MTSEILHELGEMRGELRALRAEHDRHVEKADATYATIVEMRVELAESRGQTGGILRHAITVAIAAIAGAFGGHVPLPGGH